jgi:hypothetical protein
MEPSRTERGTARGKSHSPALGMRWENRLKECPRQNDHRPLPALYTHGEPPVNAERWCLNSVLSWSHCPAPGKVGFEE